eukprot:COSAG05_NODE_9479_length_621_cov_2.806944_1_plen_29_part_01
MCVYAFSTHAQLERYAHAPSQSHPAYQFR